MSIIVETIYISTTANATHIAALHLASPGLHSFRSLIELAFLWGPVSLGALNSQKKSEQRARNLPDLLRKPHKPPCRPPKSDCKLANSSSISQRATTAVGLYICVVACAMPLLIDWFSALVLWHGGCWTACCCASRCCRQGFRERERYGCKSEEDD